jgi:molecular chaperone Hsp33
MATGSKLSADFVVPFQVERAALRGRILRLGPLLDEIVSRHGYPQPVSLLLAELVTLTATLASALKYDGVFTLQISGKGPVSILVADMTSAGDLRAYAQFDAEAVAAAAEGPVLSLVSALLGAGHLAFTVDQGADTERYQGIVALEGNTLTDCIHHYFRQSEQLDAAIKVAVEGGAEGTPWRSGAIMIQRLPGEARADELTRAEADEAWREAVALMGSARAEEMTDPALVPERLLFRLFHEPGVRAYESSTLRAGCRCSRERVERTLSSFPREEVLALIENDAVRVKCEFCGTNYAFDRAAIDALFAA